MSRADLALIDRDGVILQHVEPYILDAAEIRFIAGAVCAIRRIAAAGIRIGVVTNQSPVARRLTTMEFVDFVNASIRRECDLDEAQLAFFVCPHSPRDGCFCRKPRPGLILRAARHFSVPVATTAMVGDHETDIQAARAAGVGRVAHLLSGRQTHPETPPDAVYLDLLHAVVDGFFGVDLIN